MSTAHDHDDHAAPAHDHHEPPPPPEGETPLWLTVLGGALFVTAGLAFLLYRGDRPSTPTPPPPPMPALSVHAQAAPAPSPINPAGNPGARPAVAGLGDRVATARPAAPPPPAPSGMHQGTGPR